MTRVLVVSNDRVGASMAGPGIRYLHFARQLAQRFDVTLAVPAESDAEIPGVEVVPLYGRRARGFKRFARSFDVVVAQVLAPRTMLDLARSDTRTIYDLYVPFMVENLGFFAGQENGRGRRHEYAVTNRLQEIALATGDAFVCASERQRDLWLGALSTLGRLDVSSYRDDPSLRSLVSVVPFGLEGEPPRATAPALKGVVPGIGEDDKVLLWAGGIWNWFDPLTLIRAVAELGRRRDDVKLYFLGVRHPNPLVEEMAMATSAHALAQELGVLDRSVFFNFGWVPYAERQNYLLEADLGVSIHQDTAETRFAFRTRLLDHLWACLPTVATGGDVLGDLVGERNLGRTVAAGDHAGLARAIAELLDDEDELSAIRRNIEAVRGDFTWAKVTEPLADLVAAPAGAHPPRRADGLMASYFTLLARAAVSRRPSVGAIVERLAGTPRLP